MMVGVCLMSPETNMANRAGPLLAKCGLYVWAAHTAQTYSADLRAAFTRCLVVDMPGQAGLLSIQALRYKGVGTPALLVSDAACSDSQLEDAQILDVLPRPADLRVLLSWIECVCAAQMVLERRRPAQLVQLRVANRARAARTIFPATRLEKLASR